MGLFSAGNATSTLVCQEVLSSAENVRHVRLDEQVGITYSPFGSCDEIGGPTSAQPFATFNLTVTTLDGLAEELEDIVDYAGAIDTWILDVDQDFFSSHAPGWQFLLRFLKEFSGAQLQLLRSILPRIETSCVVGDPHDLHGGFFDLTIQFLEILPDHLETSWQAWKPNLKNLCKFTEAMGELAEVVDRFTEVQQREWREAWRALRTDRFLSDADSVFSPGCTSNASSSSSRPSSAIPEFLPSEATLRLTLGAFEGVVQTLAGRLGMPLVVTLCRSLLNGYLPLELWPRIEPGVHKALSDGLRAPGLTIVPDAVNPSNRWWTMTVSDENHSAALSQNARPQKSGH